jgi:uncharacterized membrane protein YeaQ/YmgE (transglycosylase-associated protein family)
LGAETKATIAAVGSGFTLNQLLPSDWPLLIAVFLGLIVGTIASWVWQDQTGQGFPKRWLLWQVGSWGLIFVLVLEAHEILGLSTRASMAMAATFAWLGRDGLQRYRQKALDRLEVEKR